MCRLAQPPLVILDLLSQYLFLEEQALLFAFRFRQFGTAPIACGEPELQDGCQAKTRFCHGAPYI